MPRDRYDLALWGVVLVALAARCWDLGGPSVWLDETASVREMSPIGDVLRRVAFPPLYYLLLNAWAALFGDAWWTLRAFSALTGALAVYAFGRLVLALFDRRDLMVVAAAAFALMPQALALSRQVRMYPLWMLCLLVAAWGAVAAARAPRPATADLLRYWCGVAAAAATHHYTALHVAALVLGTWILVGPTVLRKRAADWRRLAILHVPLALGAALQIALVTMLSGHTVAELADKIGRELYTVAPFRPLESLTRLVFLRVWPYGRGFPIRETVLAGSVISAVLVAVAAGRGRRQVAFLLLTGIAAPLVILALPTRSYPRLLSPAVPYVVALLVFGAGLLWGQGRRRAVLAPIVAVWLWLLVPAVQGVYRFESEPWNDVCAAVGAGAETGDVAGAAQGVLLNEPYMRPPFEVCYTGPHPLLTFPRQRRPVEPERLRAFVADKEMVWIIYARATRSDRRREGLRIVQRAGFQVVDTRRFGSVIRVFRLERVAPG